MAVDRRHYVPAVSFETLRGIVGKPAFHFAINGDTVVVVERNQFTQSQGAGQRASFVGDTFHQTAVAHKGVGVVIDDIVAVAVKLIGKNFFCQRHTHGIGNALPQWPSGGFNTRRIAVLWMARSFGVHLAEVLQLFDRQIVAAQVQQRINQHGTMAIGQDETVAIGPVGVARVVLEVVVPQDFGDVRHAHWGSGVATVGLLDGVHTKGADGVG